MPEKEFYREALFGELEVAISEEEFWIEENFARERLTKGRYTLELTREQAIQMANWILSDGKHCPVSVNLDQFPLEKKDESDS